MTSEEWIKAGRPHWQCQKCKGFMVTIPIADDFICPMCRTKTSVEQQPHGSVEIVKKCPKCGEEHAQSFTPRTTADWAEVEKAVGEDKSCPKCCITYSFAGIKNIIEPRTPIKVVYGKYLTREKK